jgi:hypothetical protein
MIKARTTQRAVLACALLSGAVLVPLAATGLVSSAPAAASSTTHKAKLVGNHGGAIEPRVKGKFTCSTLTESWTLSITGIQVIGRDGVTPWDTGRTIGYNPDPGHYYVYVEVGPPNGDIWVVNLTQDPSTGLFGVNATQDVGGAFGCGTGTVVQVGGGTAAELDTSPGSLLLDAPLT